MSVRVEVGGDRARLYPDPRGTGRFYLEARQGTPYEIHLGNRTGERIGVVVTVDGLNVVSGEREVGHGRMYVLDPWGETIIKGWRSSLQDVRRFTFVDEQASYAARSGKANGRMGWIEVSVFRELGRPSVCCDGRDWHGTPYPLEDAPEGWSGREAEADCGEELRTRERDASEAPPATAATLPESRSRKRRRTSRRKPTLRRSGRRAEPTAGPRRASRRPRSFPGTGWGSRLEDPVVVVSFQPEPNPAEQVVLRYEYAAVAPRPGHPGRARHRARSPPRPRARHLGLRPAARALTTLRAA